VIAVITSLAINYCESSTSPITIWIYVAVSRREISFYCAVFVKDLSVLVLFRKASPSREMIKFTGKICNA